MIQAPHNSDMTPLHVKTMYTSVGGKGMMSGEDGGGPVVKRMREWLLVDCCAVCAADYDYCITSTARESW